MDESTIRKLNEINRRFYETTAEAFDATRQQPWEGWERLTDYCKRGMRVLDVGCGNGRFGAFLAGRLGKDGFSYTGIDSSAMLLERARVTLEGAEARFELRDIIEQGLGEGEGQYDFVGLFGVLHHVPGEAQRVALLRQLSERVAAGGVLVFTEWRFLAVANLRERVVAWEAGMQVERGDYLLDWRRGERALRYCHAVDDAEHARLTEATGLTPVSEYRADAANLYTVLQRLAGMEIL